MRREFYLRGGLALALALPACDPFGGAWTPLTEVDVAGVDPALGGDVVLTVDGEEAGRVPVDGPTATLPLPEVPREAFGHVSQVRDDGVYVSAAERWLEHFVDSEGGEDGTLDAPFDHGTGWAVMESVFSQGHGVVDPPILELRTFPLVESLELPVLLFHGDAPGRSLAAIPETWLEAGGALPELVFDAPAAEEMTLSLAGAPPATHVDRVEREPAVSGDRSTPGAVEHVVLYEDAAGDGFTAEDAIVTQLCIEGASARLLWVEPPTDSGAASAVLWVGVGTGWSLASQGSYDLYPVVSDAPLRPGW